MLQLRYIAVLLAVIFCALQTVFWLVGDSHMVTLMGGATFICTGFYFGWDLYEKSGGGDQWKK